MRSLRGRWLDFQASGHRDLPSRLSAAQPVHLRKEKSLEDMLQAMENSGCRSAKNSVDSSPSQPNEDPAHYHHTEYFYSEPVKFGPHRALVRPREGHDVICKAPACSSSPPSKSLVRDTYGNSIAMLNFREPSNRLEVFSEVVVAHYDENPLDFLIDPERFLSLPILDDEQPELIPYRLSIYPRDGGVVREWISKLYVQASS